MTFREKYSIKRLWLLNERLNSTNISESRRRQVKVAVYGWIIFLLMWFLIVAPFIAIKLTPVFWIYIPLMYPAYIGTLKEINGHIARIEHKNFMDYFDKLFGDKK